LIPKDIDPNNGRSGMDLWKIFVLGTLREIANNHRTLRQLLGHGMVDDLFRYTDGGRLIT
jgi:hypothetical protein